MAREPESRSPKPADRTRAGSARAPVGQGQPSSFRTRLSEMPTVEPATLSAYGAGEPHRRVLEAVEASMASHRGRCLVQMTAGSGLESVARALIYRLLRFAGARRILLLTDGDGVGFTELGRLESLEVGDGSTFGEHFQIDHWAENSGPQKLDASTRVLIATPELLCSFSESAESAEDLPRPMYLSELPPETFEAVMLIGGRTSSFSSCRLLAEYFEAFWVGLVRSPSKQALDLFEHNLPAEYRHEQAVADGLKVDVDFYRPRFSLEGGWLLERKPNVEVVDWSRRTRAARWQPSIGQAPKSASSAETRMSHEALRSLIRRLKDRWLAELFPGRDHLPKTLIYVADGDQARQVAEVISDELDLDDGFCVHLTRPFDLDPKAGPLKDFREHYLPRFALVDARARGLRVPAVELLVLLAPIEDSAEVDHWLGCAGPSVSSAALRAVTPDAEAKTHLVVLDGVGTLDDGPYEIKSLLQSPLLGIEKLIEHLAHGRVDSVLVHTLVGRLTRLAQRLDPEAHGRLAQAAEGQSLWSITRRLVDALDIDHQLAWAQAHAALKEGDLPDDAQVSEAARHLIQAAAAPLIERPELGRLLIELS